MKKAVVFFTVFVFLTTGVLGCANIKDDRRRSQAEGTLVGAGIGAVLGGVLGYAIGGQRGAVAGAAIGAGAGALAGLAVGTHVANQKAKYAKEEDWLDACIASAEKVNEETRQYNLQLAADITTLEEETQSLAAQYEQQKVNKRALRREKKRLDVKIAEAEKQLKRTRFELENQEKALADARANNKTEHAERLDGEIQKLKKQIAELEGHTNTLASMSKRMSV
jgi:uncharacterized protein YcfJ